MKKNKFYTIENEVNASGTNISVSTDFLVILSTILAIIWCALLAFLNYMTHSICLYIDMASLLIVITGFIAFQYFKENITDSLKRAISIYQFLFLLLDSLFWYIISYLNNYNIFLFMVLFFYIISLFPVFIFIFVRPYKRTKLNGKKVIIIPFAIFFMFPKGVEGAMYLMNIRIPVSIQETLFLIFSVVLILLFLFIITIFIAEDKYFRQQKNSSYIKDFNNKEKKTK